MSGSDSTRTIRTDFLARVEGEGAMFVQIDGDQVRDVKLRIYEPPRFFEAMLRGRAFTEAPDITSRICGICPIAYQMSAVRAIEDACGVAIDSGPIRELRRLIYYGEWIESLGLHVYLLHAPDFLGYPGFVEMARDHPQLAERGLQLKKAGNTLMTLVGGREIHPINIRVGGFYRAPSRRELSALIDPLERAREIALATVRWAGELPIPDVRREPELVALAEPGRYPIDLGRIVSDQCEQAIRNHDPCISLRDPLPGADGAARVNRSAASVVVIGVGNDLRADDAAGLEVARRLRKESGIAVKVHAGEAIDLLELWSGADAVVLVDTVRTGEATGTIHRFDATSNPVPLPLQGSSSHTIGVAEAIELARALGSLPRRVIVYGVEGARFVLAGELSDEVERSIGPAASAVREEAHALLARG